MGLLDGVLGGGARRGGGMSPITMALLGVLAYRTMKGKGRLAEMLGTGQPAGANPMGGNAGAPDPRAAGGGGSSGGGFGGLLGGLLGGGAAGGLLSGGLQDL